MDQLHKLEYTQAAALHAKGKLAETVMVTSCPACNVLWDIIRQ